MVAQPQKTHFTPEEYLAFERASDTKHEYWDGEIVAMSGAKRNHNVLTMRFGTRIDIALEGQSCEVYAGDMRVKVERAKRYFYPDVVVACEPQFEDAAELDTLLNPLIIVEVLSPSTERFDRGAKFQHYQTVASLQEYVLVAQDQMRVEHYTRQAPDLWTLRPIFGENGVLQLTAVDVKITLADLYSKVHFEEAEQPDAE